MAEKYLHFVDGENFNVYVENLRVVVFFCNFLPSPSPHPPTSPTTLSAITFMNICLYDDDDYTCRRHYEYNHQRHYYRIVERKLLLLF